MDCEPSGEDKNSEGVGEEMWSSHYSTKLIRFFTGCRDGTCTVSEKNLTKGVVTEDRKDGST